MYQCGNISCLRSALLTKSRSWHLRIIMSLKKIHVFIGSVHPICLQYSCAWLQGRAVIIKLLCLSESNGRDNISFSFDRPSVQKVMEHPFFWADHSKMDFLSTVSERIPGILNRDTDSTNFLDEFNDVADARLHGGQWSNQLPTRPSWGDKQKTPQQLSSGNEGTTLGLIRFTRNIWTHRIQNIAKGHFASEVEVCNILLGSFNWMVTEIYRLSDKHFALDVTI